MKTMDNYPNRALIEEKGLFSCNRTLKYLSAMNVFTVSDLLNNKDIVFGKFLTDDRMRKDLTIAVKLLECKYLGIDPEIEITNEDSLETISDKLGFRSSTTKIFMGNPCGRFKNNRRYTLTSEGFRNIIKKNNESVARAKLLMIDGIGEIRVDEIYYKSSIVIKYGKKKTKAYQDNILNEYFDLLKESKRIKELDAQIDSRLDSLLDRMASEGILTEENISKHIR